jgi:hypothetical protein
MKGRLTDRVFLAVSYLLLVCLVGGMGWWVKREFDNAQDERCSLARAELLIGGVQALALERVAGADFKDEVTTALIRAVNEIQGVCDIKIEPEDLFEDLRRQTEERTGITVEPLATVP